jgi:hypothetical protein
MVQALLEEPFRLTRRVAMYILRTRMMEAQRGEICTRVIRQDIHLEIIMIDETAQMRKKWEAARQYEEALGRSHRTKFPYSN